MTVTLQTFLIVCPLVFLAGFLDAIVGGGGLVALPAYLVAGLPPHMASATNKCSSVFGTMVSTARFLRQGRFHRQVAVVSALTALVGSALGSRLNLLLSEKVLRWVLVGLLPIIAVFLFFKRDFGAESRVDQLSPKGLMVLSGCIGLVLGAYDGFFGPGAGTFMILAFTALCGFDLVTASGNAKVVNLCSNLAAFVTFATAGKILWVVGIPAACFSIAGHYVGSSLALTKGAKIIRPMFFVVLGLLLLKIVSDLLG